MVVAPCRGGRDEGGTTSKTSALVTIMAAGVVLRVRLHRGVDHDGEEPERQLKLASEVVRGFEVHGFWSAVGGTLLLSLFTFFVNLLIGDSGRVETVHVRRVVRF